jgi:ribosomal protein S18 acetylase RimI-like enzyme
VRAGGRALRVLPWVGAPGTAQLVPLPGELPPSVALVHAGVREAGACGYRSVVTAALGPRELEVFEAAEFEPVEYLHLLARDLDDLPEAPPADVRRPRRSEWDTIAAVDGRAFQPFWHLDVDGIVEARRATPSNRVRVGAVDGRVMGYGVFGRSGRRGYVQRLAVDPDAQGRGLGTALLLDGLRWMRARGATSALINTQVANERALALYLGLGFRLQVDQLAVLGRDIPPP